MFKSKSTILNLMHIGNDGFKAALLLLLPFIAKDLSLNLTKVGVLGSTISVLEIFLAIPAGFFAARIGGLKMLIISLLFYTVGFLLSALSLNYYLVILAFLVSGIGFAIFHPIAFAVVTSLSTLKERGKNLGNFTAVGDIGRMGISSLITFITVYLGWRKTSLACFAFLFVWLLFIFYKIGKKDKSHNKTESDKDETKYLDILKNKNFYYRL